MLFCARGHPHHPPARAPPVVGAIRPKTNPCNFLKNFAKFPMLRRLAYRAYWRLMPLYWRACYYVDDVRERRYQRRSLANRCALSDTCPQCGAARVRAHTAAQYSPVPSAEYEYSCGNRCLAWGRYNWWMVVDEQACLASAYLCAKDFAKNAQIHGPTATGSRN